MEMGEMTEERPEYSKIDAVTWYDPKISENRKEWGSMCEEADGAIDKVAALADLIKKGAYTPWIIIVPAERETRDYYTEKSKALGIPEEWVIVSGYLSAEALRKLGWPIKAIDITTGQAHEFWSFNVAREGHVEPAEISMDL